MCFSEDAITILLDVLLFKPIQHISYVFDTIRVFTLLLTTSAAFEMVFIICTVFSKSHYISISIQNVR